MIRHSVAGMILCSLAAQTAAGEFSLVPPLGCDLAADCHIQQYVDHDPSAGASDYTCGRLSYDGHQGTDFALPSLARMEAGVDVLASAAGTVTALRDGMSDTGYSDETAAGIEGRACGNGVVIRHPDGWETQYCHLKQGSVTVAKGQQVAAGAVLGQVGLSGQTEFPHVHLSLRKDGAVVDPFDPDGRISCADIDGAPVWQEAIPYRPGGLIAIGISDRPPSFDDVKAGTAGQPNLSTEAPLLVLFAHAFGGRRGDALVLQLDGPGGKILDERVEIGGDQARLFRYAGRKKPRAPWPAGMYSGAVQLIRDSLVIDRSEITIDLR